MVSAICACVHEASSLHSERRRIASSQLDRTASASLVATSAAVAQTGCVCPDDPVVSVVLCSDCGGLEAEIVSTGLATAIGVMASRSVARMPCLTLACTRSKSYRATGSGRVGNKRCLISVVQEVRGRALLNCTEYPRLQRWSFGQEASLAVAMCYIARPSSHATGEGGGGGLGSGAGSLSPEMASRQRVGRPSQLMVQNASRAERESDAEET
eukprot:scaffold1721_cov32-Tisochrysis_lutea.AAC.1